MRKQDSKTKKTKNPFAYVTSFSKIITMSWLVVWIESILFSQIAAWFGFGDANAISEIGRTITEIGAIICGFYFSTKCLENLARGYEEWRDKQNGASSDNSDEDAVPDNEGDL